MNILTKLTTYQSLSAQEASDIMRMMMSDKMSDTIKAAILTALAIKGATSEEITAMARVMRKFSVKVPVKNPLLDTCGTGGSGLPRLNVSTATAFVLAACGVKVAKHGNRAASGRCGSFDLLEALGAKIELGPTQVAETIKKTGLGFMFAPLYHPAMKHVMPVRQQLGIKTIFNILGPLTNPAGANHQILGVSDPKLGPMMANVLKKLNTKRALIVCGFDGLDEITLTGPTRIWELKDGKIRTYIIKPQDFGLKVVPFAKIRGSYKEYNVKVIKEVFSGKIRDSRRDIIVLNAAAGLYVYGKVNSIKAGLALAGKAIDEGRVEKKLNEYIKASQN